MTHLRFTGVEVDGVDEQVFLHAPPPMLKKQLKRRTPCPLSAAIAGSSDSTRAPAMQAAHSSGLLRASKVSSRCTTTSADTGPPGLRTRNISANTRRLSGARLMTPLEITTSTLSSAIGSSS
jgi:hypothetical protein